MRKWKKQEVKDGLGDSFYASRCGQVHIAPKTSQVKYYRAKTSYLFVLQCILSIQAEKRGHNTSQALADLSS